MALPLHESTTLYSYLSIDEEEDYRSYTNVHRDEGTLSSSPVPEVRPLTAPNPFVERGEITALVAQHHATDAGERITTNPLGAQQELILQREESARRCARTKRVIQNRSGYVFSTSDVEERLRHTEDRSLATWVIVLEATSPEDIAFRLVMHERYLEPFLTTQGQYKSHLESLDHGVRFDRLKACPYFCSPASCLKRMITSSSATCIASDT